MKTQTKGKGIERREFLKDGLALLTIVGSAITGRNVYAGVKRGQSRLSRGVEEAVEDISQDSYVPELDFINPVETRESEDIFNPGKYDENESDELTLARLLYAEVRSEWKTPKILEHKGSSVINRSIIRNMSIKEVIFQPNQYKSVTDENKDFFYSPEKYISKSVVDKMAWERCYKIAKELVENGAKYETEFAIVQRNGERDPKVRYKRWAKNLKEIDTARTKNGELYHFYVE